MSHPRYQSVDAARLAAQVTTKATNPTEGLAVSTAQTSLGRWAMIERWWSAHDITYPLAEQDILRLLAAKEGRSHSYLASLVTTIVRHYPTAHGPAPSGQAVRRFLCGYAREYPTRATPVDALRPEEYCAIIAAAPGALEPFPAARLRMMLTVAYAAWLRGSEVVPVRVVDLRQNENGVLLLLPPFKHDPSYRKVLLALPRGTGTSVAAELTRYGEAASGAGLPLARHGPLFPPHGDPSRSIGYGTYRDDLRAAVAAAGIARRITTHSARRGGATECAKGPGTTDERLEQLLKRGRWKHIGSALGYVADAERFDPEVQLDYPASSSAVSPSSALTLVSKSSDSSM